MQELQEVHGDYAKFVYDLKGGYNLTGVVISGSMWKTVDKAPFSVICQCFDIGMLAFYH